MNDAELIEAGRSFWRFIAEMEALEPDDPSYADDFDVLADKVGELEDQIMATPADTFAGIAVKLRIAFRKCRPRETPLGAAIHSALDDCERLARPSNHDSKSSVIMFQSLCLALARPRASRSE